MPRGRFDASRELFGRDAWDGSRDDGGQLRALATEEIDGLAVARVHDGEAEKRWRCVGDADDRHAMVVHLEYAPELQWFIGEEQDVAGLVDNDRVGLVQAFPRAEQHLAWRAGERRIIETNESGYRELSVERSGNGAALEEPHRPLHAGHAPHPSEVGILECLGLFPVFGLRIHDPDLGVGHVEDLACRPLHDAREDRGLVLQQEGAERNGEDEPEVFGPVAGQHTKCDEVHRFPFPCRSVSG